MARELGMNPKNFGKLANNQPALWKLPLPDYIQALYFKRFGKTCPAEVRSIEQIVKAKNEKAEARRQLREVKRQSVLAQTSDSGDNHTQLHITTNAPPMTRTSEETKPLE